MKFSVLLPTRNRLDLLRCAVETVRRQDDEDWEIIISDNDSEEDIAGYVDQLKDPRIHYSRVDHFVSVTENWNNCLAGATGDYVIMLGDDDGLMPGFFRQMRTLIERYEYPDWIYIDACLYAYAGALPEFDTPVYRAGYNTGFSTQEPYMLDRDSANQIVRRALNMELPVFYNMQLSVIHMAYIRSQAADGPFFQSPFPDYYATVTGFLKAQRMLICQQPLVTIGVSRKSFGYYFFSGREQEGQKFLNNISEQQASRLQSSLMPVSVEYTCRFVAMDTVAMNHPSEVAQAGAMPNLRRYRAMSILLAFSLYFARQTMKKADFEEVCRRMTAAEWLRYGLPYTFYYRVFRRIPLSLRHALLGLMPRRGVLAEITQTPWQPTTRQSMLEVFEHGFSD
jgi:glycosyltransferase involved in cell wall biosynthesis